MHFKQVIESDCLPKMVCDSCWSRMEEFYEFCECAKRNQAEYLDSILKHESDIEAAPMELIDEECIGFDDFNEIDAEMNEFVKCEDNFDEDSENTANNLSPLVAEKSETTAKKSVIRRKRKMREEIIPETGKSTFHLTNLAKTI